MFKKISKIMKKIIRTTGPQFIIELDKNDNPDIVSVNSTVTNGQMTKENSNNNLKARKNGKK
jgi:hypothetical protein